MNDVCRHCGRPVIRGRYLPWTHSHGIPRSFRPHRASPIRPTSLSAVESIPPTTRRRTEAADASPAGGPPPRSTQPVASGEARIPG